jgi:hypothetical protein
MPKRKRPTEKEIQPNRTVRYNPIQCFNIKSLGFLPNELMGMVIYWLCRDFEGLVALYNLFSTCIEFNSFGSFFHISFMCIGILKNKSRYFRIRLYHPRLFPKDELILWNFGSVLHFLINRIKTQRVRDGYDNNIHLLVDHPNQTDNSIDYWKCSRANDERVRISTDFRLLRRQILATVQGTEWDFWFQTKYLELHEI